MNMTRDEYNEDRARMEWQKKCEGAWEQFDMNRHEALRNITYRGCKIGPALAPGSFPKWSWHHDDLFDAETDSDGNHVSNGWSGYADSLEECIDEIDERWSDFADSLDIVAEMEMSDGKFGLE